MDSSESSSVEDMGGIFNEPDDFRPKDPPSTVVVFERTMPPTQVSLRLVGSHPLWGHHLWNAAKVLANYFDTQEFACCDKNVLELGAGAALPSLITVYHGARAVVITDYPDDALIENMRHNVALNTDESQRSRVFVTGYMWGSDPSPVLRFLNPDAGATEKFDCIILSDLLFNHSQHVNLLKTCRDCLRPGGSVLCFFSHHVPKAREQDLVFFDLAAAAPFEFRVELLRQVHMPRMFPEDDWKWHEEELRSTVNLYRLTLPV